MAADTAVDMAEEAVGTAGKPSFEIQQPEIVAKPSPADFYTFLSLDFLVDSCKAPAVPNSWTSLFTSSPHFSRPVTLSFMERAGRSVTAEGLKTHRLPLPSR